MSTAPVATSTQATQAASSEGAVARFALGTVGAGICAVNLWLLWHEEHTYVSGVLMPATTMHLALFLGGVGFGVLVIFAAIPGAVGAVADSAKSILGAIFPFVQRFRGGNSGGTS